MKKISIVDYGLGNIFSVKQAFEFCNKGKNKVAVTSLHSEIETSDFLVLPGVGAFKNAMHEIETRNLTEAIHNFALSGRPLLGICLGMQILASESNEFGNHKGLNLIPGKVSGIGDKNKDGSTRKVPVIGWKNIYLSQSIHKSSILSSHQSNPFYLVHSYHFTPLQAEHVIATYSHGDSNIIAAVQKDNIIGCQFHPEKSGPNGLDIINRFLHL
ncbi:imidazole glycerol phosphate synthase subunit HisH [Gammaproteobacteria bacterium]|nr:imidazole glycerol phosphate synthase subunit HisH [Gammaproteobacteria bacterium]MDA9175250.1 imidazole glycerol phosphate synthase subunit HisH [Gammaproteobacteria bacterium]MDA9834598.1 imidazole glycerol phosphate synthase subunit HisH [Gammaproteobacteria bacterium]MDA9979399.1 imidazole glycerol phosphate synthase subunit HisH [Gammaproteobacteria bacterium]MDC3371986.1 imidazole glycerol phosphate synthase subunit HisH [Gammaproteobacteria bacterium]